jgi:predicted TIM-barrel fold metal-dependent hydrolase
MAARKKKAPVAKKAKAKQAPAKKTSAKKTTAKKTSAIKAPAIKKAAKKLGRIDLHHHFLPQAYMIEEKARSSATHGNTDLLSWTPEKSIAEMDKAGIAFAFASTSTPGVWYGDVELGRRLARQWTDSAVEAIHKYPSRFGLFAPLPLPDTDGSLAQIRYALDEVKADGLGMLANYEGKWLGDPSFAPVMEELNRREAIVYVHPTFTPCITNTIPGANMQLVEFPFETTRTIANLILSGTTTKFPKIRWIFAHNGGATPMLIGRLEEQDHRSMGKNFPAGMRAELRKFYYDNASAWNSSAMAAIINLVPKDHLFFGSDYPFLATTEAVHKFNQTKIDPAIRAAIERSNAFKLFPRLKTLKI